MRWLSMSKRKRTDDQGREQSDFSHPVIVCRITAGVEGYRARLARLAYHYGCLRGLLNVLGRERQATPVLTRMLVQLVSKQQAFAANSFTSGCLTAILFGSRRTGGR
jgi:hypothetical protein